MEFFHQDDEKNELIRTCEKLKDHRVEIAAFFASNPDDKERGNFIKGFFDNTFIEQILSNGQRVGYRAYDDMLHLWRGSYLSREREVYYRWRTVASHIEGMILMDRWLAPGEVFLPTEEMQKQTILRAKAKDGTGFDFPQAAVDYVIAYGNSYENGKFAIYEHFLKNETPAENIRFLKDSYGVGGHSDAIPGSGLWEDHDSKGIRISRYAGEAAGKAEVLLSWPMVEKRIRELIAADRYLTPDEKKKFPEYVRGKTIPENQEPPITGPKEYKLSLGDSVCLGAQAFELLALGDTEVTLFDPSFPLFHKVLPRQEFFDLLKENPLNDQYLRAVELTPEVPETNEEKSADGPETPMDQAKRLISEFCAEVDVAEPHFTDMRHINIAYSTVTDMEIPVQVCVNLIDFSLDRYVEGVIVDQRKYDSLANLISGELVNLDFDELVSFTDEQLAKVSIHQRETEQISITTARNLTDGCGRYLTGFARSTICPSSNIRRARKRTIWNGLLKRTANPLMRAW